MDEKRFISVALAWLLALVLANKTTLSDKAVQLFLLDLASLLALVLEGGLP